MGLNPLLAADLGLARKLAFPVTISLGGARGVPMV
jgi:hypothetical protein